VTQHTMFFRLNYLLILLSFAASCCISFSPTLEDTVASLDPERVTKQSSKVISVDSVQRRLRHRIRTDYRPVDDTITNPYQVNKRKALRGFSSFPAKQSSLTVNKGKNPLLRFITGSDDPKDIPFVDDENNNGGNV